MPASRTRTALAILVLSGSSAATAQQASQPERSSRDLTQVPVQPNKPAVQPSAIPTVPGLGAASHNLPGRRFLPEGTFLTGLSGTLIRTSKNDLIFLPDEPPADRAGEPAYQPFVLVPSQKLAQLDAATKALDAKTVVNISGQVYVYRDRQYLFASAYSVQPSVVQPSGGESGSNAAPARPTDEPAPASDPRVTDLIRELESQRSTTRLLDPERPAASGAEATPTDAEKQPLTNEGTLFSNKRGRLVRLKELGGRLGFSFDNDTDSPSAPPMIIVPCAMLKSMEETAASRGESLAFNVSGRVLVYEGRNYLLPIFFQVKQPGDITPLQ
ncbi:MAG: hypothetical protein ACOYN0_02780 [Phycisphaerales bacterium]